MDASHVTARLYVEDWRCRFLPDWARTTAATRVTRRMRKQMAATWRHALSAMIRNLMHARLLTRPRIASPLVTRNIVGANASVVPTVTTTRRVWLSAVRRVRR